MKTIAQQLNITEFPFYINDKYGNEIYFEDSRGYWEKKEYDANKNRIYYEDSKGYWFRRKIDINNNEISFEDSEGFWVKREFDASNNEIYFENSLGKVINKRPKTEFTLEEIAKKFEIDISQLKIKHENI